MGGSSWFLADKFICTYIWSHLTWFCTIVTFPLRTIPLFFSEISEVSWTVWEIVFNWTSNQPPFSCLEAELPFDVDVTAVSMGWFKVDARVDAWIIDDNLMPRDAYDTVMYSALKNLKLVYSQNNNLACWQQYIF